VIPLAIIGMVVVMLVAGLVLLVVNPRTRPFGLALLFAPLMLVVLGFFGVFYFSVQEAQVAHEADLAARDTAQARVHAERARAEPAARTIESASPPSDPAAGPSLAEKPETAASADAASSAKSAPTKAPEATDPSGRPAGANPPARRPARPNWVEAPPRRVGDAYEIAVATDPFATRLECEARLPQALERAVAQYAAVYLGDDEAASQIRLPLDFLRTKVVAEEWEEPFDSSVGPMVRIHALLRFDRAANARIDEAWQRRVVEARLWGLGTALCGVLATLAVAWAYVRLDLATGGAYRWRLRMAAALVILAILLVAVRATA
jgi:hypothetical protein